VVASVMAGAAGYLLKETRGPDLVTAIREAAAGRSLLDSRVTGALLERFRALIAGEAERPGGLTAQERRVLALVAEGKTNREIAAELYLSEKTVKNYVSNLLGKLNLRRRAEAAAYAARIGLGRW
ncbi:MAG: response regulator transcription factor, partial [Armatimonadetes bacterium]|nr:response regulator transcription factor [Armatimonadota bacterium]